ncbi:GNAT family N-acetyltransferase [Niabella sp.]|uniref:GNAT family N-acetyltransferase n=1 Tax=Niabella sp. TaxID=1962976 RepID=UPI002601D591|nr:GNAT family N-acetyltransferase [Niabella sp.]
MHQIEFEILRPEDQRSLMLIADWYVEEWQIPVETTQERLRAVTADRQQCQVLMTLDGTPIATGGIYDHVGLLERLPHFNVYKKWLALVYTRPSQRGRGYGAALCNYIHDYCRGLGFEKIHLFTHTAETLYRRLGWNELERMHIRDRNIVVMEKDLFL